MIRFLSLLFLLKSVLFGCSLCTVYSPKTDVNININASDTYIKTISVKWTFAQAFSDELLQLYDTDLDATFNEDELLLIEDSLLAYVEPKNYLISLTYGNDSHEKKYKVKIKKQKLNFKKHILSYEFDFDINAKIVDKNKLTMNIYDDGGYFLMVYNEKNQKFNSSHNIIKTMNDHGVNFVIDAPTLNNSVRSNKKKTIAKVVEKAEEKKENLIEKSLEEESNDEPVKEEVIREKKPLDTFVSKIKKYLVEIEKGEDNMALVFLLFASFVYGVIHALGPGHGKALAFSYFSAQKSTYTQAFFISLATAFIHIVGALVLVVISIFILQSILNSFIDDSITYITQTSAILIMLLSIFILYRKIKKKSCACSSCCAVDTSKPAFSLSPAKDANFVKAVNLGTPVASSTRKKEDIFFVLTAGLIPCPGTVLLFVYAFILKTYFSVILASIAISLGMGVVIFASSFLGVSLNKVSAKSHKITNILEITAPIFMFILGLLLLLNADIL